MKERNKTMKSNKIGVLLGEAIAFVICSLLAIVAIGILMGIIRYVWLGY